MPTYQFKCTPPNERSVVITLHAASLEEAAQRAEKMWMHQQHRPILLVVIADEPATPLVTFGGLA